MTCTAPYRTQTPVSRTCCSWATSTCLPRTLALPNWPGLLTPLFTGAVRTTISDASLYDIIWLDPQYTSEYTGQSGVDRYDETAFAGDDRAASLAVSDHRPVWAVFRTDGPDDDGPGVPVAVPQRTWGQVKDASTPAVAPAPVPVAPSPAGALRPPAPITAGVVAPVLPAAASDTVYVTHTGQKYQRNGCRYLAKSRIPLSLQEAAASYSPCGVCKAPVLAGQPPAAKAGRAAKAQSGQCQAITKKGTQCKRQAEPGSSYCWQHQPK